MPSTCYCGSNTSFAECCQPKHLSTQPATTPEELMRSRYSAFCCGNSGYLVQTLLPKMRKGNDADEIHQTTQSTRWNRLQIIQHQQKGDCGTVEFVAFFTCNGEPRQLHERSQFTRENDLWFYVEGEQLPPIKLQRNDPCWCGSGEKLKKCCGNK